MVPEVIEAVLTDRIAMEEADTLRTLVKIRCDVDTECAGGEIKVASVAVTAGPFPPFHVGEQYLVVLVKYPRLSLGSALHVNAAGDLESLQAIAANTQSRTPLIGKKASDVVESLRK
jgi:hypothetical protein